MTNTTHGIEDIEKLLPHRRPMRLVEEMARVDNLSIETSSIVRDTWPTAENGCVRTIVLAELIAQSAAVLQGWKERHEQETAVGGLLVGIPHATPTRPTVPVGSRLRCRVHISHGAPNYRVFEGEVQDAAGVVLLTGAVQAFRPDADDQPGGPR
jgi:predicted hotdog family 3-hydroxylacyl-ACP dehydratase